MSKKKAKKCLTFWECFWQPYKFQSFIENSNPNSQLKIYENSSFVQSKSSSPTIPDRNCRHTNVRGGDNGLRRAETISPILRGQVRQYRSADQQIQTGSRANS